MGKIFVAFAFPFGSRLNFLRLNFFSNPLILRNHLFGQSSVILRAVRVGGVLEDRLSETRGLGQTDVAANPGLEHLGGGPGLGLALGVAEEVVHVLADLHRQPGIDVVDA